MKYLTEPIISNNKKLNSQQVMKEENIMLLFDRINNHRDISRAGLVRITKLSPTTVSTLIDELVAMGLVTETGLAKTTLAGRKPIKLKIAPDGLQIPVFSLNRWGIQYTLYDLEYNEIEALFVPHRADQYGGFDEDSDEDPDSGTDYADLIYDIFTNKAKRIDPEKVAAICISHPGLYLEEDQTFSCSALHVSIRKEVLVDLERKLGYKIFIGNSSMCFAYAEKKCLNNIGEDVHDLLYLNVTNGIGAGIVYHDEIFTGPSITAGELGHLSIDYKGKKCRCGSRGCLENYVNTDAVLSAVKKAVSRTQCSEMLDLAQGSYDNITLEMVGEAYDRQIEAVRNAIDDIAEKLFTGIYGMICITGIRRIVIGGGIERLGDGFLNKLVELSMADTDNVFTRNVKITYAKSGFKGDSVGIAKYFIDKVFTITQ